MINPIDFILNFDVYLGTIIATFGLATYLFLFLIIFCETGLVVTPFLPGDSLIFIAGTFASKGDLNIILLFIIITAAAIFGNEINYLIGRFFGEKILEKKLIKKEYLDKTKEFYQKYGTLAIVIARFIPIVRTIAPFTAGIGKMEYKKFLTFNILGGILWVFLFLFAGYFFGQIPLIEKNLSLVIILIIIISVIPPIVHYIKNKIKK